MDIIIDARTAVKKDDIVNPLTKSAVRYITNPFITSANRPKVRIVIGKVNSRKIGFIKALKSPRTNPAKSRGTTPSTSTPGSIAEVTPTATAFNKTLVRKSLLLSLRI